MRLTEEHGLPEPAVHEAPPEGYRHRARLAVRGRAASPKIGIFQEGSHRIVDIPNCVVQHPLINEVARSLKRAMKRLGTPPYSDVAHAGLIRYLQVVVERTSQTAQLVVVTNAESLDSQTRELCDLLKQDLGPRLNGLFWNGNPERSNAILGPHWQHLEGASAIHERFAGARVFYPPGAFGQSNLGLYERLVEKVQQWAQAPSPKRIVELYAGTGAIGLGLVPQAKEIVFNEINPDGLKGLQLGIDALPEDLALRARVEPGSAATVADALLSETADLVIADPPRKGLDAEVTAALLMHRPRRFIYVSCDLDSFCRDTATLTAQAGYRLHSLEAFALFPYTDHVETLGLFEQDPSH
jgi:23S rRNA (uracil-5-)-methyltransferase RumA